MTITYELEVPDEIFQLERQELVEAAWHDLTTIGTLPATPGSIACSTTPSGKGPTSGDAMLPLASRLVVPALDRGMRHRIGVTVCEKTSLPLGPQVRMIAKWPEDPPRGSVTASCCEMIGDQRVFAG